MTELNGKGNRNDGYATGILQVPVRSELVDSPAAVRRADNPDVRRASHEGLPASPFRTDTWPGITE